MSAAKYIVIGGNPFRGYTGTLTYTSLKAVGVASTKKEAEKLYNDNYDDCGGLLAIIDQDGKLVDA